MTISPKDNLMSNTTVYLAEHTSPFQATLAPWPATFNGATRTQILKHGVSTGAIAIVHTVTAGKTFYLTSFCHTMGDVGRFYTALYIRDAGDGLVAYISQFYTGGSFCLANSNSFPMPIVLAAGYDVCVQSNGGQSYASIQGWEQ